MIPGENDAKSLFKEDVVLLLLRQQADLGKPALLLLFIEYNISASF